jgi:DNA polymerase III sliding clamp (beta) subunit (PCNA family)
MITFDTKELKAALRLLAPALRGKGPYMLEQVLVSFRDGEATLTASNMDIEISVSTTAAADFSGEFLIHNKRLKEIATGDKAVLDREAAPTGDFPRLQPDEMKAINAGGLSGILSTVAKAAAKGDVRLYLTGVLIDCDANAVVAADGIRLAWRRFDFGAPGEYIIPAAAAKVIAGALKHKDAVLSVSDRFIVVESDGFKAIAKTIGGTYPNWQRVTEIKEKDRLVIKSRADLIVALKRIKPAKHNYIALLAQRGLLHIEADELEEEAEAETVEIEQYGFDGAFCSIDATYLLASLQAIDEQRVVMQTAENGAVKIIGANSAESDGFDIIMGLNK